MVHLMKLAAGVHDVAVLAQWQAERLARQGEVFHLTRNFPRRAAELADGGSIYWVIAGALVVRQRILGVVPDEYEDGSACARIRLDPELVAVSARPTRAFQGWRYLEEAAAPADIQTGPQAEGADALPESLRRELAELALL
jgi:hypothetical protein